MSAGEDAARHAMEHSVSENKEQVAMTEESRVLLADLLEERMSIAVADGIQAVMTNPQFWATVIEVLQKQAVDRTGRFLVGGLTRAIRKVLWTGLFLLIAYSLGGWAFLKAVWAVLNKG